MFNNRTAYAASGSHLNGIFEKMQIRNRMDRWAAIGHGMRLTHKIQVGPPELVRLRFEKAAQDAVDLREIPGIA